MMECDLLHQKNILDYRDYKITSTQLQGCVGMHVSGCIIKVAKHLYIDIKQVHTNPELSLHVQISGICDVGRG